MEQKIENLNEADDYVHPGVSVPDVDTDISQDDEDEQEENEADVASSASSKRGEVAVTLNTGMVGKLEYVSPEVSGELDGILISSDNIINIKIVLDEFENIVLYQKQGFSGQKFLSLRNDVTYFDDEKAQNFAAKWKLNDKLKIQIDGSWKTLVKVIIRYS